MPFNIAFFGSSLVSAYWNGAATYYRGIIKALAERGHSITFYEPDAFGRQQHRDIDNPQWARVVVYDPTEEAAYAALLEASHADIVVKASGVGVLDQWLEQAVLEHCRDATTIFWDVDAPATLAHMNANLHDPLRPLIRHYDMVLTYGGGEPVVNAYRLLGAQFCAPIYNALDPSTHYPVEKDPRYRHATLGLLANRLPDREARIGEFFFKPAMHLANQHFLLGGSGWQQNEVSLPNVECIGHVFSRDHNAFNRSPLAVLNVNRESMASTGFSPPTRLFEVAGAAACLITDAWEGLDNFLEPGAEVLVAHNGEEVAQHLTQLTPERALRIGHAARLRLLASQTYRHRAVEFERALATERASRAYA